MEFNSQICTTRKQSERLLALGLKRETADCILVENPFEKDRYIMFPIVDVDETLENEMNSEPILAWSLHRLIEIAQLPKYWECISGNWYEEVVATIQSKIHIGELNKEYLEHLCGKY